MDGLRRIAAAAGGKVNLIVGGCGALAAAVLQSWPVAGMAALAYAALVAIDATARGGREEEKLPDPRSLRDSAAKHAVEALLEARRELADVMKRSPGQIQRYTEMALVAVPELEQHAAQLVGRAEELGAYLSSVSADSIRRDVKQLQAQAEQTSDATAREQFEQAGAAREEQLRTLQELAEARQRLEGHLSRLVATYQSLPARVVHLRTLDAQAADTLSAGVNLELDRMNNEISAFEQTLKELSARVPA